MGIQPIRFQGSIVISQSDFDNVENGSEGALGHEDFAQWGFKHLRTQVIRFVQVCKGKEYSLDCREGHMKKKLVCVCLCQGQKSKVKGYFNEKF